MAMLFSVNYWGSCPDEDNDDCITGEDFATVQEALAAFHAAPSSIAKVSDHEVAYIEIDGIEDADLATHGLSSRHRKNPTFVRSKDDDGEWRREQAMQAGMALGIQAYNEHMGND